MSDISVQTVLHHCTSSYNPFHNPNTPSLGIPINSFQNLNIGRLILLLSVNQPLSPCSTALGLYWYTPKKYRVALFRIRSGTFREAGP